MYHAGTRCNDDRHDRGLVPSSLMVGMLHRCFTMERQRWPSDMGHGWSRCADCRNNHIRLCILDWPTDRWTRVDCKFPLISLLILNRDLIYQQGVGNGFVVSQGPVYVAETTGTVKQRGPLVGILMGFACVGTACAYWIDFGFTYATGQVVWRLPVAMQIIWSLLAVVLTYPNADSPRWYFLHNRPDEGKLVLQQIYGDNVLAEKVAVEIQTELKQEVGEKLRFSDFFVDKSETKAATRIRDGVILVGVAYLMGINMIFYYMTTIFQVYIGLAPTTASICSGAATTLLAIGAFVGSIFCEKGGRRKWLLWGSALQSVFMIAFVALLAVGTKAASSAAAAMLFGWILVFSPTWAPLPVRIPISSSSRLPIIVLFFLRPVVVSSDGLDVAIAPPPMVFGFSCDERPASLGCRCLDGAP